jgi:PAS domain S-box-containing protein
MPLSVMADLLTAFDIVVMERLPEGTLRILGTAPEWFSRFYPETALNSSPLLIGEKFPFLENFLVDAEKFWSENNAGLIKSDAWTEPGLSGNQINLDATALCLEDRKLLIIESLSFNFERMQSILQTARDMKLGYESRIRAEEVLRKTEERNRALLHAIPDLMFRISQEGILLDIRGTGEFGLSAIPRECLGKNIGDVFPSKTAAQIMQFAGKALQDQQVQVFEYELGVGGITRGYEARIVVSGENEALAIIRDITELKRAENDIKLLHDELLDANKFLIENILTNDGVMHEVFRLVQKVKDTDIGVLLQGESGTGKELIARAIHFQGKRKKGPFVVVNCAAIPRDLLESELFGHERGAFTGAYQRKTGKFELADGGTVFLDEIGEMDMGLQSKLLRVLQTKQFERIGGTDLLTSDVRIISATNKNLQQAVTQKQFRQDLYYRLASFPILIPPLRERRSDILLLAEHFLKRYSEEYSKKDMTFSRKALKALYEYHWFGNVRELEHAIERAVVLAEGNVITVQDLPLAIQAFSSGETNGSSEEGLLEAGDVILPIERLKEEAIRHALKVTDGNIVEAARKLQIGRATLYRLMEKYKMTQ